MLYVGIISTLMLRLSYPLYLYSLHFCRRQATYRVCYHELVNSTVEVTELHLMSILTCCFVDAKTPMGCSGGVDHVRIKVNTFLIKISASFSFSAGELLKFSWSMELQSKARGYGAFGWDCRLLRLRRVHS